MVSRAARDFDGIMTAFFNRESTVIMETFLVVAVITVLHRSSVESSRA